MQIIICEDYNEVSLKASEMVAKQINKKPNSVLGLATGSTPMGAYNLLAEKSQKGEVDFEKVVTFNLDEYCHMNQDSKQSYHHFMNENLFSRINIKEENVHILNGMTDNVEAECEAYEKAISKAGGIDLQVLSFGQNGHIGFNMPGANLLSHTHLTDLTDKSKKTNLKFFECEDDVPSQALTMGMGTILQSKKIILLATGASKHRAVKALLDDSINTNIPVTLLKAHPDVTLICDRTAYDSTKIGVDLGGTDMKFGVVDDDCNIIEKWIVPTPQNCSGRVVAEAIAEKCTEIAQKYSVNSIGIGTPGVVLGGKVSAVNLNFDNYPLGEVVKELTGITTEIGNDANCAALGEATVGAAKGTTNSIMITLGTGVGGGIIIDNAIYTGKGTAGELGHSCFSYKGKSCPCGLTGCFEQYASATALVNLAKENAEKNPDSILGKKYAEAGKLNGLMIFDSIREGCPVAKKVLDEYTDVLAAGINGYIYVFDPEIVVISGGISNAGDILLKPICQKLKFDTPVVAAKFKNNAGIIGASLL